MGLLEGKKVLITGLASKHSIAYGIAEAFAREGAEMAFTFQNEKLEKRVNKYTEEWSPRLILPCDVSSDAEIEAVFAAINETWGELDIIVHSVAFAPADQLEGDYIDAVSREGFRIAHDISSYSFAAMAKYGRPLMKNRQASMITLSYLGAQRSVRNYNVMGLAKASLEANVRYMAASLGPDNIRVNAISAGPIRTLAASGIKDFRALLEENEQMTPLRKNVTIEEVGNTAMFLCSDLASGITGEIVHVDAGFHSIAL